MWEEFQFYASKELMTLYPQSDFYDEFFLFKKKLLPLIDKYGIINFLILDEGPFFLIRIELDRATSNLFEKDCIELVEKTPNFIEVKRINWSPENDARNRIIGSKDRAKGMGIFFNGIPEDGWKIETWCQGHWIPRPDDMTLKVEKFSKFMSKVVGPFTKAYLKEMPERIDDRWLLSVFIHLLLHSVSEQRFEKETRDFPWI